jgi:membrane protein implicated in regulation of membrane protease activity
MLVEFWHWWAFGAFLLIVELLAPGMFFLWMAEAAVVTGILLSVFPLLDWQYQLIAFSVLSVASIVLFRKFLKKYPIRTDRPSLNRKTDQYLGRVFTLEHPIVNGLGKIRVDDSTWKIQGQDCPANTNVRVVSAEGVILRVEVLS